MGLVNKLLPTLINPTTIPFATPGSTPIKNPVAKSILGGMGATNGMNGGMPNMNAFNDNNILSGLFAPTLLGGK